MTPVPFAEFDRLYREALDGVWAFWSPEMQRQMAAHHHGWGVERFDFGAYLRASSTRFHRAYRALALEEGRSVCDVGGFWGAFPLVLRALGYRAVMTESLRYYSGSFLRLFDHLARAGVEVVDLDPFEPGSPLPERYDAVTVMAVLEHYPHSLRAFMENVVAGVGPGGRVFVEVPNVAFWPKRMAMLRGRSPLTPVGDVYRSSVPFIGHHHEFTRAELREVAELSGLAVREEYSFNYSPRGGLLRRLLRPVQELAFAALPDSRECLAVLCTPRADGGAA